MHSLLLPFFWPHSLPQITFHPIYHILYQVANLTTACNWDNVVDFRWHRSTASPNWSVAPEELRMTRVEAEGWDIVAVPVPVAELDSSRASPRSTGVSSTDGKGEDEGVDDEGELWVMSWHVNQRSVACLLNCKLTGSTITHHISGPSYYNHNETHCFSVTKTSILINLVSQSCIAPPPTLQIKLKYK